MPELPEVETTLRGIKPYILNREITEVIIRHHGLRWPIPADIEDLLLNEKVLSLKRRGKYILLHTEKGTAILHLGMSGTLRILTEMTHPKKHDHVDIVFDHTVCLRFNDPRRFGALLWTSDDPLNHPILKNLGPEPLSKDFTAEYLLARARARKAPIKTFIMDSNIVVGVGNIYAAEALFKARIHPKKASGKVNLASFKLLTDAIVETLQAAIKKGGTTLKDFVNSSGEKGYFSAALNVYGRAGKPCVRCKTELQELRIGQRSSVFCPKCQK